MAQYLVARANFLAFAAMAAILLLVGGVIWEEFAAAKEARGWSDHTFEVLSTIKDLSIAIRDAETGQRGYLLTGDDSYLAPYSSARDRVGLLLGGLQQLTSDNPVEQDRLRALAPAIQRKLEELGQTIGLRRDAGFDAALRVVHGNTGRDFMADIEAALSAMSADEQALLKERLADADGRMIEVRWLVSGGTAIAIAMLLWAARLLKTALERSTRAEAEQRRLASQLRTSLDSLSQGVGVFSTDRLLTNWNDCFQELLDLPKAMVRQGTPYAAFQEHTAEDGTSLLETEEEIRHGRRVPGEAIAYERKRASGRQLELRRSPMPDGGFVLTVSDMTKRAQAEAVLREAQKMQAVGQLTGGIAHDFNNLLTVIIGSLESLMIRLPRDNKELLVRAERALWGAQRGAMLTSQLLAFARKQPLAPAPIDLAAAVPGFVPLLRRTLGETIDVRYVDTAGLWPALADPAQLESALLNLALNARDAMPGGGHLTIELANKVLDEDYARLHAEVTSRRLCHVGRLGHGHRHDARDRRTRFRAILHDQGRRQGHRPRPRHGVRLHQAVRRPCKDL